MADIMPIVRLPNFQPYPRFPNHAVIYGAQETIEETLLQGECFLAVEGFPLLPPVGEEPFFSRGYPFEPLDRSARMQSVIGPGLQCYPLNEVVIVLCVEWS